MQKSASGIRAAIRTCFFLALALGVGTATTGSAGGPDLIRVSILDGGMTKRGTYLAAFEMRLSDGWKTYWRSPGDAGIPPAFTWKGSRNIGGLAITWPTPRVFDQNGMRSIGYVDRLVLPVEITPANPNKPVRLRGRVDLGICKDVCVPETLSFDHDLDAAAGRNPAISAALAQRPHSATEAGVRGATCHLTPIDGGLRIEARIIMPSAGGKEVAVFEPGDPRIWASEATTQRQGDVLSATSDLVHVNKGSYALDRSAIRITVLGSKHAVDIRGCAPG